MASLSPISALQLLLLFFICFQHLPNTFVAAKSKVHIVYMGERQHSDPSVVEDLHHRMLANLLGSKEAVAESILYSYKHGFSGFAARLTDSQAEMIAGTAAHAGPSETTAQPDPSGTAPPGGLVEWK